MYESTPLASRSAKSVAVDNLLRRALRVSDPGDPDQVADGLLARYPNVADQIEREKMGLNYRSIVETAPREGEGGGALAAETVRALDDLERDLATLSQASEIKNISVEVRGWGRAVRKAAGEGLAAARLALDVSQLDRAMAARRLLGEYARLARLVGTLNGASATRFRRFAHSLDTVAALILVGIGEGLAAGGVTRSTTLVRVSAAELQARRDAIVHALRALKGAGYLDLDQDTYPRAQLSHGALASDLDVAAQSDLRALLDEGTLAVALDGLIDLAAGSSTNGLRELRTTSTLLAGRLERLVAYSRAIAIPAEGGMDAPPMLTFAAALQTFVDAFRPVSGSRLIFIARPPIVAYGLHGIDGPSQATERLIRLAIARGQIAELVDCTAAGPHDDGDDEAVPAQILFDYCLERIDRAIDLYALGSGGNGEPEAAAAAFVPVLAGVSADLDVFHNPETVGNAADSGDDDEFEDANDRVIRTLRRVALDLMAGTDLATNQRVILRELNSSYQAERRLAMLAQTLSPRCHGGVTFVQTLIKQALDSPGTWSPAASDLIADRVLVVGAGFGAPRTPAASLHEGLELLRDAEDDDDDEDDDEETDDEENHEETVESHEETDGNPENETSSEQQAPARAGAAKRQPQRSRRIRNPKDETK
jgi:hypothetical protein